MARYSWTAEQLATLGRLFPIMPTAELAQLLGLTPDQVSRKASFLGIKKSPEYMAEAKPGQGNVLHASSVAHRFPKGLVPWNKGIKGMQFDGMQATQFKKGAMPHNWVPVGSYRTNPDGFLEVKFSEEPGPYTKRWIPIHRKVWIEVNGPVPDGHKIAFKPGMKTTVLEEITLDRLECITHAELMARNTIHNLPPELVDVTRLRGVLTRAINKRAKDSHEHQCPPPPDPKHRRSA